MWKNVRIKRGFISLVLVMVLVLTGLSPVSSWADENAGVSQNDSTQIVTEEADKDSADANVTEKTEDGQKTNSAEITEDTAKDNAEKETAEPAEEKETADKQEEKKEAKDLEWNNSYLTSKLVKQGKESSSDPESLNLNEDFSLVMKVSLPVSSKNANGDKRPYLAKDASIRIPLASGVNVIVKDDEKDKFPKKLAIEEGVETPIPDAFEADIKYEGNNVFLVMKLLKDNSELGDVTDAAVNITMDFSIKKDNIQQDDKGRYIEILGKKVYLTGEIQSTFSMEKSGVIDFNKGEIEWRVAIEGKGEDGAAKSLEGLKFEDSIEKVGKYVEKSFSLEKEDGDHITVADDKAQEIETSAMQNKGIITYTFPEGTPDKVIVKFRTKISNIQAAFEKTNTAYLKSGEEKVEASSTAEVKWSGRWGVKYDGNLTDNKKTLIENLLTNELNAAGSSITFKDLTEGDDSNSKKLIGNKYTVQWNIIFDATGKKLEDVTFEDKVSFNGVFSDNELKFIKAELRTWDNGNWSGVKDISDYLKNNDGKYEIEKLDTVVKITITSEIDKDKVTGVNRFTNLAYFKWNDQQVRLGHDIDLVNGKIFIKELQGHTGNNKYTEANPTWDMFVSKDYVDANKSGYGTYVYDPIIYDADIDSDFLKKQDDVDKVSIDGGKELLSGISVGNVVYMAAYRKMVYEKDSATGLKPNVYTLMYEGRPIGSLLEFDLSNYKGETVIKNSKEYYKFSFRTYLVEADTITGGAKREVETNDAKNQFANRAYIVKGAKDSEEAKRESFAEFWPDYNHRMIQKDALTGTAAENIIKGNYEAKNANDTIQDNDDAYSKEYKSIIYRLSVNAANVKSYINNKKYMDALIKDSIDNKFELIPINKDVPYLVYNGTAKIKELPTENAYVEAEGSKLSNDKVKELFTVSDSKTVDNKSETEFKFKKLERPYVILYRAQLKDEDVSKNEKGSVDNTATFTAWNENQAKNSTKYNLSGSKKVNYDSKYLNKVYDPKENTIVWTIAYNPFMLDDKTKEVVKKGKTVQLYDELEDGLNVFVKEGKPWLEAGAYKLYKVDNNGNKIGEPKDYDYTDKLAEWLEYKKDGKKDTLLLTIPEAEKMKNFVFEYSTTLAENALGEISNTVKIIVDSEEQGKTESIDYSVGTSIKVGSFTKGHTMDLTIHKIDEKGNPLKGVEFTLIDPDGNEVKQSTDRDGNAHFGGLKAATPNNPYKFKETVGAAYYVPDKNTYSFEVVSDGGQGNEMVLLIGNLKISEKKNDDMTSFTAGRTIKVTNKSVMNVNLVKADFDANNNLFATQDAKLEAIKTPLSNVRFNITSGNSIIATGITDKDGKTSFAGLSTGTYRLNEVTPNDYKPLEKNYDLVVTTAAVNAKLGKDAKDEFAIKTPDGFVDVIENTVVVLNQKTTTPDPNPNPDPGTTPVIPPTTTPEEPTTPVDPDPTPLGPTPTTPTTPTDPNEDIIVDEDDTPQGDTKGKTVKGNDPDEDIVVDEDDTPQGVKPAKNLPKTGGSDNLVYYLGGAMFLMLAAGVVVRRKKYNK